MKPLRRTVRRALFTLILALLAQGVPSVPSILSDTGQHADDVMLQQADKIDIQWFKKEMRVGPNYMEKREGILGMSWAHFFTMSFLVLFFFGALIAYHRRTTRTTRILRQLLKED